MRPVTMTRFYVVRHGRTRHNTDRRIQGPLLDDSLDDTGRAQAAAVGARFRKHREDGERFTTILSSPLKRAAETADAIARAVDAPLRTDDGLMEFHWGRYLGTKEEGETAEFVKDALARWEKGDLDFAAPEGESPRDAWKRLRAAVDPVLAAAGPEDAVVVVAHGRVNKILLADLVHGDVTRMQDFPQFNTAVTLLERADADAPWRLAYVNDQSHLPDEMRGSTKDVGSFV